MVKGIKHIPSTWMANLFTELKEQRMLFQNCESITIRMKPCQAISELLPNCAPAFT
jgi:hypothetical protein